MKNLSIEQRIQRCHVMLMRHPDFCLFSGIFMVGKIFVDDTPTAMTDGQDVYYGRDFMSKLDDKQMCFVILHEAMHKAYRHMQVWQDIAKEDAATANMAMDYVINLQMMDYDPHGNVLAFPRINGEIVGLYDQKYRGMDTKQVYDLLKKEKQNGGSSGGSGGSGKQHDKHDWDKAKAIPEKEAKDLAKDIDHALREGSILAGKMKGNVPISIKDLLYPKIDWRVALRDFIKSQCMGRDQTNWRRPNRKFIGMDIIMPSFISEKAHSIVIADDTSGSCMGEQQRNFITEMVAICNEVQPEEVHVLYWDSSVTSYEKYVGSEVKDLLQKTKPVGGGGTTPDCIPAFLKDHRIEPQAIVVLTDGCFFNHNAANWGPTPVLWCVIGNPTFAPVVGKAVFI